MNVLLFVSAFRNGDESETTQLKKDIVSVEDEQMKTKGNVVLGDNLQRTGEGGRSESAEKKKKAFNPGSVKDKMIYEDAYESDSDSDSLPPPPNQLLYLRKQPPPVQTHLHVEETQNTDVVQKTDKAAEFLDTDQLKKCFSKKRKEVQQGLSPQHKRVRKTSSWEFT